MNSLFDLIWARKFVFFGTFFLVFTLSYLVLLALDFLPEPPAAPEVEAVEAAVTTAERDMVDDEETALLTQLVDEVEIATPIEEVPVVDQEIGTREVASVMPADTAALPTSIVIKRLGKTVPVLNPTSRVIADLDAALLSGVVRHPDSATLAQDGNIFILGHSSYLPQVFNKNFQAFNGIQNLEWGDKIELYTASTVYEYRVEKVYHAQARELTVPIAGTGKMLTLATCNSFGSVDDRYIVEAKLMTERAL